MTKVFVSKSLLQYRREKAETVREVVRSQYVAGVKSYGSEDSFLKKDDLLPSPRIDMIDLTIYEGKVHDLILFATSDDFGIANLHVTIMDDKGNVIESGDAFEEPLGEGIWNYFTKASVPSGIVVTVYAVAIDPLWGVETRSKSTTIQ